MKVPSVVVWLMIALLCGVALASGGDTSQIRWAPDLIAAREASAKFKVPLLIHFYGDGCLPCKTLEQRVFSQPEVIGTLNKFFICTAINANKQPGVASEFAVHSWPTDIFMSPDGEILFRGVCPQDVQTYMGILNNVAVMNRDRNLMMLSKQQASNKTLAQQAIAPQGKALSPQQNISSPQEPTQESPSSVPSLGVASQTNSLLPTPESSGRSPTDRHHYYQPPAGQENQQQLGKGLAGQPSVQNGPLVPGLQPPAIAGSTHSSAQPSVAVQRSALNQAADKSLLGSSIQNGKFGEASSGFPPLPGSTVNGFARGPGEMRPNLNTMSEMPQLPGSEIDTLAHRELSVGDSFSPTGTRVAGQLVSAFKKPSQEHSPVTEERDLSQEWADVLVGSQPTDELESTHSEETISSQPDQPKHPNLDGFCPVALRLQQQWVAGREELAVLHLGRIYHLASQEARQEFLRTPDAYTPVLSGCDPMILLQHGELIEGSTQHGLFEGNTGQLLLFSSMESKSEFQQNFERNMRAIQAVTRRVASSSSPQ